MSVLKHYVCYSCDNYEDVVMSDEDAETLEPTVTCGGCDEEMDLESEQYISDDDDDDWAAADDDGDDSTAFSFTLALGADDNDGISVLIDDSADASVVAEDVADGEDDQDGVEEEGPFDGLKWPQGISGLLGVALLQNDVLYFKRGNITWDGRSHRVRQADKNLLGGYQSAAFRKDSSPFRRLLEDLLYCVEQNPRLRVPLATVAEALHDVFQGEDITGLTFLNLTACYLMQLGLTNGVYHVRLEKSLVKGVPGIDDLAAELIRSLRAYDGQYGPFELSLSRFDSDRVSDDYPYTEVRKYADGALRSLPSKRMHLEGDSTLPSGSVLVRSRLQDAIGAADLLEYTLRGDGTAEVGRSSHVTGDVVIPREVQIGGRTYPVTGIGDSAFDFATQLVSVEIPDSVVSIGERAFTACVDLGRVTIPDSVVSIGANAFSGCTKLADLHIGSSVATVGDEAFSSCLSLESIDFPNSVVTIGARAFRSGLGLRSVTIPESVSAIGGGAFNACPNLERVHFVGNQRHFEHEGAAVFTADMRILISRAGEISGRYEVPDSVEEIADYAFANPELGFSEDGLDAVVIPDSVTTIGDHAFENCRGLTNLTIPSSVTSIGKAAYAGCDGLESVELPDSLGAIPAGAFSGCGELASIAIPHSVKSIGRAAFGGCHALTSVDIPDSVTSIGAQAFAFCSQLVHVSVPKSLMSMEMWLPYGSRGWLEQKAPVFEGCDQLKSVTYRGAEVETAVVEMVVELAKAMSDEEFPDFFNRKIKSKTADEVEGLYKAARSAAHKEAAASAVEEGEDEEDEDEDQWDAEGETSFDDPEQQVQPITEWDIEYATREAENYLVDQECTLVTRANGVVQLLALNGSTLIGVIVRMRTADHRLEDLEDSVLEQAQKELSREAQSRQDIADWRLDVLEIEVYADGSGSEMTMSQAVSMSTEYAQVRERSEALGEPDTDEMPGTRAERLVREREAQQKAEAEKKAAETAAAAEKKAAAAAKRRATAEKKAAEKKAAEEQAALKKAEEEKKAAEAAAAAEKKAAAAAKRKATAEKKAAEKKAAEERAARQRFEAESALNARMHALQVERAGLGAFSGMRRGQIDAELIRLVAQVDAMNDNEFTPNVYHFVDGDFVYLVKEDGWMKKTAILWRPLYRGVTDVAVPALARRNGTTYRVTVIGGEAFKGCANLRSVVLPQTIEEIGAFAFEGCISLTSLVLPASVRVVIKGAFVNSGLSPQTIARQNPGTFINPDYFTD